MALLVTASVLLFRRKKAPKTVPAAPVDNGEYSGETAEMPLAGETGEFVVEQDITLISTGDS